MTDESPLIDEDANIREGVSVLPLRRDPSCTRFELPAREARGTAASARRTAGARTHDDVDRDRRL